MTISIEKYVDYQDDTTPQTTYYEERVFLNRGADKERSRIESNGIVVVRPTSTTPMMQHSWSATRRNPGKGAAASLRSKPP